MRFWLLLSFLCLPLVAGRELAAQNEKERLQTLADSYFDLSAQTMSENGRWIAIRKSYNANSDTLLLFDSHHPEQPVATRVKAKNIVFLSNNYLLLQNPKQAELLNPEKQKGLSFNGVKQCKAVNNNNQFLLYYGEEENKKLELRDCYGELLNTTENVASFFADKANNIYAVTEREGKSGLIQINSTSTETVYQSVRGVHKTEADPGGTGIMIYEKIPDSESTEILYLDLASKELFPLREVLPLSFQNGFSNVIREGDSYFLKIWLHTEKADTSPVDIWYGNDYSLEKKFAPATQVLNYLWIPKEKRVWQTGNDSLTVNVNIGSDRYFLCFDPYYLKDYIRYNAPLKLYVYDRTRNNYTVSDTINHELYASKDGIYALTPKEKAWILHHIPSGSKKSIPLSGPGKPWFTNDGRSILLEGEGALWKYDLEKGKLEEAAAFKGYQVTIINGEKTDLGSTVGYFSLHIADDTQPLVIKLYNPQENTTSYVLWHRGKTEVIVPPAKRNIRKLKFNSTYDCFSWIEEDYNLPPRLVFKQRGKKEEVLFQSNKSDREIISFRQEVISYLNSDSVPLKGILYYPLQYDPSLKYPMVVHIYQVQSTKYSNKYPVPAYGCPNNDGFDLRLLLESGYFVYFPDIVYGARGTGLSALDCVNSALDALRYNASIDKNKIGLIGHSHGGYETNFIATHSDRFAAYVAGAGNIDIVRSYFSYNYNFLCPFYFQYENGQYEMPKSFAEDKTLYFQNNPIYNVEKVNAPILLWTGMKDQNIYWEQTMEFYIGLKRNNKKVVALFYINDGHNIDLPESCRDLVSRIMNWFDYFLKGEENVEWIDKEMKEDAP